MSAGDSERDKRTAWENLCLESGCYEPEDREFEYPGAIYLTPSGATCGPIFRGVKSSQSLGDRAGVVETPS